MIDDKQNLVFSTLLQEMKKHPSIDATFRRMLLTCIKKHMKEVPVVKNKFKINTQFFSWFIVDMGLDKRSDIKEEKNLYRNFLRLKRFRLVHPKSASFFPKSLTLLSINPNHYSLLVGGLSNLDVFTEARKILLKMLKKDETIKEAIYIYLRLFHILPFGAAQLKDIQKDDIICSKSGRVFLVLKEILTFDVTDNTGAYKLVLMDTEMSNILKHYNKEVYDAKELFNDIGYEKSMKDFKSRYMPGLTIPLIKNLKKNFHLLHTTPLALTMGAKTVPTVPLTLSELLSIFPEEEILSVQQKEIEKIRIEHVFKRRDIVKENVLTQVQNKRQKQDESDVYGMLDIESLSELLSIKGTKYSTEKVQECIEEIKVYLANEEGLHAHLLFEYVLYMLQFLLRKKLALSTVNTYLRILNKHLFKMIENLSDIKPDELAAISNRLEVWGHKSSTVKAVYRNIRRFFRYHKRKYPELMHIADLYYPKSLVFKSELLRILDALEVSYRLKYKVKKIGPSVRFHILQRKVLVLFGFYFGLRKSEIRSRLMEDFYYYGDNFYIDVNIEGLRKIHKKLKNTQSKRRVHASITDEEHRKVINEWLSLRENMEDAYKFLFLAKGASNNVLQSAAEEKVFDEITQVIKEITQRYCTYHSLRHSFATYRVKEMLEKGVKTPYALIELAILIGHQTPDVTLSSYVHAEVLELL